MSIVGLQFSSDSQEFGVGVIVDLNGLRHMSHLVGMIAPTEYNLCAEYTIY